MRCFPSFSFAIVLTLPSRRTYDHCMSQATFPTDHSLNLHMNAAQRQRYYAALQGCFGAEHFRSPALGARHIDKGIYFDQLQRWFVNFNTSQFLIMYIEEWANDPVAGMDRMLRFLDLARDSHPPSMRSDVDMNVLLREKRLVTSNTRMSSLPDDFQSTLIEFYRPYNELLNRLLGEVANVHTWSRISLSTNQGVT